MPPSPRSGSLRDSYRSRARAGRTPDRPLTTGPKGPRPTTHGHGERCTFATADRGEECVVRLPRAGARRHAGLAI